jgi:hypothetical protein
MVGIPAAWETSSREEVTSVPGRFLRTVGVGFVFALACAGSAGAFEVSFDGEVLRYRGYTSDGGVLVKVRLRATAEPPYLGIRADPMRAATFGVGPGCHKSVPDPPYVVHCPLGSTDTEPRYRFNLGSTEVRFFGNLRGVVYGGDARNFVVGADRVYGGIGDDDLTGARVYGGPGRDRVFGSLIVTDTPAVHGGPGGDDLYSPGRLYGGPGDDYLEDFERPRSADMLVGGPGQDTVYLTSDRRADVVRVRGGGVDYVHCETYEDPDPDDALFVDRTDHLDPSCRRTKVLYSERPRYPYP